jgi:hypothetical protein
VTRSKTPVHVVSPDGEVAPAGRVEVGRWVSEDEHGIAGATTGGLDAAGLEVSPREEATTTTLISAPENASARIASSLATHEKVAGVGVSRPWRLRRSPR